MQKKPFTGFIIFILFLFILGLASLSIFIAIRERADNTRKDSLFQRADEISEAYHMAEQQPSLSHTNDDMADVSASDQSTGDSVSGYESLSEGAGDINTATAHAAADSEEAYTADHHVIIFVGDSRTVGMGNAMRDTDDLCVYVGMSGEGYYWFAEDGIREMEAAIKEYPKAPVVINLGVNDPEIVSDYLKLYRLFPSRYPQTTFYFLSVNPVTREAASRTNQEIRAFNSKIKAAFPDQYIDSYRWMKLTGFECVDGVHYSEETYRDIHDFTVKAIFSDESSRWFFTGEIPWMTETPEDLTEIET